MEPSLLTLPTEVRRQILSLLLHSPEPLSGATDVYYDGTKKREDVITEQGSWKHKGQSSLGLQPQILRTCKALQMEGEAILHDNTLKIFFMIGPTTTVYLYVLGTWCRLQYAQRFVASTNVRASISALDQFDFCLRTKDCTAKPNFIAEQVATICAWFHSQKPTKPHAVTLDLTATNLPMRKKHIDALHTWQMLRCRQLNVHGVEDSVRMKWAATIQSEGAIVDLAARYDFFYEQIQMIPNAIMSKGEGNDLRSRALEAYGTYDVQAFQTVEKDTKEILLRVCERLGKVSSWKPASLGIGTDSDGETSSDGEAFSDGEVQI